MDMSKLECVIEAITEASGQFVEKEIDFDALKKLFSDIPEAQWKDSAAMKKMVEIPLYDEDIYDIALDMNLNISEFVCELMPKNFWENGESIVSILELICTYNSEYPEYVSISDFEAVLNHVTDEMWKDKKLATKLVDKVTEWARRIDDLNCVDELIPKSFFEDEYEALYVVRGLCNDDMNADNFCLFPSAAWQYQSVIIWILSNLEDELSGGGFTMYPVFRGSKEEYISSFIEYIPDRFKSDKSFVLELLGYSYFSEAFGLIYDWIDPSLWSDGEFVSSVIKDVDSDAITRASEALFEDEEFMSTLEDSYCIYEWGCELAENGEARGITLILRAAERGTEEAQFQIAEMYRTGDCVEKNPREALKWYNIAAENGSADAQYYLAEMYRMGSSSTDKNFSEALKWYKLSAENGNYDAMHELGFIYYRGDGVEQNYNEAYYWFKKSGWRDLPYYIHADMNFYVDKYYESAFRLYHAALEQGVEEAGYKIGEMYYYGLGVEQDYNEAFKYLKYYNGEFREEDFDFAPAKVHYMLSEMYQNGWGVQKNTEEAEKLCRAAEKGEDY